MQDPGIDDRWDPLAVFAQLDKAISNRDEPTLLTLSRKFTEMTWKTIQ
ncbi:MAG: hypothetical protein ACTSU5_05625 [Promethearchaeota archaeon]